ncbi:hypothetical protein [Chamaesiphon minutus]|uniref:hypothetical protein n=1 Tax=Chamaesiphon minutus TaxID=1173032 RepID=UPI0002E7DE0A|nr:hypothetical protein [Chamaesiphon minutus]
MHIKLNEEQLKSDRQAAQTSVATSIRRLLPTYRAEYDNLYLCECRAKTAFDRLGSW